MVYGDIMNPTAPDDVCRITVVSPRRRVDVALPAAVPFAQLFPAIAHFSRLDAQEAPGGWALHAGALPVFAGFAVPVVPAVVAATAVTLPAFLGPAVAAALGMLAC